MSMDEGRRFVAQSRAAGRPDWMISGQLREAGWSEQAIKELVGGSGRRLDLAGIILGVAGAVVLYSFFFLWPTVVKHVAYGMERPVKALWFGVVCALALAGLGYSLRALVRRRGEGWAGLFISGFTLLNGAGNLFHILSR